MFQPFLPLYADPSTARPGSNLNDSALEGSTLPLLHSNFFFFLIEVGCHFLFQGIFPTQGSNSHLLHWQVDSLPRSHQGSPNNPKCSSKFPRQMLSWRPPDHHLSVMPTWLTFPLVWEDLAVFPIRLEGEAFSLHVRATWYNDHAFRHWPHVPCSERLPPGGVIRN